VLGKFTTERKKEKKRKKKMCIPNEYLLTGPQSIEAQIINKLKVE